VLSVWKRHGDFDIELREFSTDFRVLVEDIESAYKLGGHRKIAHVEVRPYGDFIEWARAQEPDWDRYAWDGTKVLVEQGRLPKSAMDHYDNPNLERAGVTIEEWTQLGFEHYVDAIARSIAAGKNVPPLVAVEGEPIDGRHRTLAALRLGLPVAPVINLGDAAGLGRVEPVSPRKLKERLGRCLSNAIRTCSVPQHFKGCPEIAHVAARAVERLGYEAIIVVGRGRTSTGEIVGHVWVEIPMLDLGIETNPSQMHGIPVTAMVVGIDEFDAYETVGYYPEVLQQIRDPSIARLLVTEPAARLYDKLAGQVARCVGGH
jgi:hypothetical protein